MAGQKYFLVIDDDPDFMYYVSIVLSANGYRVRTATSAGEGLEMMRQDLPDLVMLDVMISYALDGWNVSRQMQSDSRLRDIPVLIVWQSSVVKTMTCLPETKADVLTPS